MSPVVYLSLVIFFAKQIEGMRSPSRSTPNSDLGRPPSGYLSFKAPPSPSYNPCDTTKLNKAAPDAHVACHNECMNAKTSVGEFYDLYPDYRFVKFLHGKCGSVNEGKCDYLNEAGYFPICFCYTPSKFTGKRGIPLFFCRLGIPFISTLTNAGIGLTRLATGFGKNTGERPQTRNFQPRQEEQDGEPEGFMLVTDLYVSGTKIRAIVDTGSGRTIIHPRLAGDIIPFDHGVFLTTVTDEEIEVAGKTTIHVQLKNGITIAVTGAVAAITDALLLGNDFFLKHAAKIKIAERTMDIFTDQTWVEIPIKFRQPFLPGRTLSLHSGPGFYSSLEFSAQLNGKNTNIVIDTGASSSIIRKEFVNPEDIRPANLRSQAVSGGVAYLKGLTVAEILVKGVTYKTHAFVPDFPLTDSLILGNKWNKDFVELIDFERGILILKRPGSDTGITIRANVPFIARTNVANGT